MRKEETITAFYDAFKRLDPGAMSALYAEDVQFDDPAFSLRGRDQAGGMWHMLCEAVRTKGQDVWKLEVSNITADSAHWEARYRFSATGRIVENKIDARFTFNDAGLIQTHQDSFDFWRWSRQALGPAGLLLGWTPLLRGKVRQQAHANLQAFLAKKGRAA
jgi:ketosteroid isomerase-like protein